MDFHHLLADRSIRSMHGLEAFSALPGAPVLPDVPSRRDRMVAAWRRRRAAVPAPQALRPMPVAGVAHDAADRCRMAA